MKTIKIELLKLGKKQIDLLAALREKGFPKLYETQLSLYLSGRDVSPQGKAVLQLSKDIINEWKAERRK